MVLFKKFVEATVCSIAFTKVNYTYARLVHSSSRVSNEERNDLYSPQNIIRVKKSSRMSWAGHAAHVGERRVVYKVLVGKPEGKRQLGKPNFRWADSIKMDRQEMEM
jgi:hypothetical protein